MKITVTRALAELKTLQSRINKAIHGGRYIAVTAGKRPIPGFVDEKDFENYAKSKLQSVKDLIKRRNAIKSAIVVSNANTRVKIGNTEMTVAEAIERKSSIEFDHQLLQELKEQYTSAISNYEKEEKKVQERFDEHLKAIFGRDAKIDKDVQDNEHKVFMERNAPRIVDPLKLRQEIEDLEKEITDFEENVDFSLSEINARTEIEIPD